MPSRQPQHDPPASFATTRWTLILRASGEDGDAQQALAELCHAYWLPLYVYVRRRGHSKVDAEDLTQGFFADLLARDAIKRADPSRGYFRRFLLTALINFLHNAHDRAIAARRGGMQEHLSIDFAGADGVLELIAEESLPPDRAFDRSWTLALLDRALRRLGNEQEKLGKRAWFDRLRPLLQAGPKTGDYEAIAAEFGVSRNVVAVAVHRLGVRYRQFVREEIGETVSSPDELEAELRHLLESVSS